LLGWPAAPITAEPQSSIIRSARHSTDSGPTDRVRRVFAITREALGVARVAVERTLQEMSCLKNSGNVEIGH